MKGKFLSFFKSSAAAKGDSAPAEAIERARTLHQQRQLQAAAALYEEILAAHPNSAEAHYRSANVLKDQGALADAVAAYDKAIALKPDYAHAYCNRAVVLGQLQRLPESLASYDRAIALDPTDCLARCNRGMLLNAMGQKDAALKSYDGAIECNPAFAPAHFARAALLQERKQWASALASYDRATALDSGNAAGHYNRGTVLMELQRWADALASYDRTLALNPEFALAHAGRANALERLGRAPESLVSYDQAIKLQPDEASHYDARGVVLLKAGRFDLALDSFNQAIAANPDYAQAHFNRGGTLERLRDFPGALASYHLALAKKPGFADFCLNLALASLKVGDYVTGWAQYEARWEVQNGPILIKPRHFSQPLWLGAADIAGKTILLHGEQGLGDSLQFCRYCELVAGLGARVILEVPEPLVSVCTTLRGVTQVIAFGASLPAFDLHCPLMSLPLALKTRLETIPSPTGYLSSDPHKVAVWQERLGPKIKPRIGLTWSGSQAARTHGDRCFPLAALVPHLPRDFEYYCLQTEITAADQKVLAENPAIRQFDAAVRGFSNTAALCECLDLVVSIDTSIVHLNGALGKDTWVLVPVDNDWRWLLDREDSPWYATVRVFRQQTRGDWNAVFQRVATELYSRFGRG